MLDDGTAPALRVSKVSGDHEQRESYKSYVPGLWESKKSGRLGATVRAKKAFADRWHPSGSCHSLSRRDEKDVPDKRNSTQPCREP